MRTWGGGRQRGSKLQKNRSVTANRVGKTECRMMNRSEEVKEIKEIKEFDGSLKR